MWKSILTALIAGIAVQQSAFAQGVSTADVNIVSVNGAVSARDFTCTVVINNQNDDDARRVRVIVLMPLQVRVLRARAAPGPGSPGVCAPGPLLGGFIEYATCDFLQLPQGPSVLRTITVTSTLSTAAPRYPYTCSAFIYSAVGDINKTNNYKTWP
jgi:hypothetical protein